jgi:uncharacterized caspase-like protein
MKKYALLIGINEYQNSNTISSLKYAEQDAKELQEVLENNFKFEIACLRGPDATRKKIFQILTTGCMPSGSKIKEDDTFIFFFAGHGQWITGMGYVLHPYDGTPDAIYDSVAIRDLKSLLSKIPCYQSACILDTCRNLGTTGMHGRGKALLNEDSVRDIKTIANTRSNKLIQVLYGCDEGEQSLEDDQLHHGILTYHLLEVLHTAKQKSLTFQQLSYRASDLMRSWLQNNRPNVTQEPFFHTISTEKAIYLIQPAEKLSQGDKFEQSKESEKIIKEKSAEQTNQSEKDISLQEIKKLGYKFDTISLINAIGNGNIKAVKLLLQAGIDVNVKYAEGWTPLIFAVFHGTLVIAKYLITIGAYINERTDENYTPLMVAAMWGNAEMVKILIQSGADINAVDKEGVTALTFAIEMERKDVIRIIQDSGGRKGWHPSLPPLPPLPPITESSDKAEKWADDKIDLT